MIAGYGYPSRFVDRCQKFFNKIFETPVTVTTVPKKEFLLVLSYLGIRLTLRMRWLAPFVVTSTILRIKDHLLVFLSFWFQFKDVIPKSHLSGVVYKNTFAGIHRIGLEKPLPPRLNFLKHISGWEINRENFSCFSWSRDRGFDATKVSNLLPRKCYQKDSYVNYVKISLKSWCMDFYITIEVI